MPRQRGIPTIGPQSMEAHTPVKGDGAREREDCRSVNAHMQPCQGSIKKRRVRMLSVTECLLDSRTPAGREGRMIACRGIRQAQVQRLNRRILSTSIGQRDSSPISRPGVAESGPSSRAGIVPGRWGPIHRLALGWTSQAGSEIGRHQGPLAAQPEAKREVRTQGKLALRRGGPAGSLTSEPRTGEDGSWISQHR